MITAFIILSAVAVALGGYIGFTEVRARRKRVVVPAAAAEEECAAEEVPTEFAKGNVEDVPVDPEESLEVEKIETTAQEIQPDAPTAKEPTAGARYIVIKYSKSFTARLIQSEDATKRYYSELKTKLLSYDGVKSRITWKSENFRKGRKTLAKIRMRGKTLALFTALDPQAFIGTKYKVEDASNKKSCAATPCMYRVKTDRRLAYAKELISRLAEENGLTENTVEQPDYASLYPYEKTDALIERKLIKVLTDKEASGGDKFRPSEIRTSVSAAEADSLMRDEVAASLIVDSGGISDKTKTGIVNIDTLSRYFESGEEVTLDKIKERVKGFNDKTTYLKVLARGTLDKPLTVEADAFSIQAVKMIALTGGKAIKK